MIHLFTPNSILSSGALKMVKNHPRICTDLLQLLRPNSAELDTRDPLTVQRQTPGTTSQGRASSQGPLSAEPVEHESLGPASTLVRRARTPLPFPQMGAEDQHHRAPRGLRLPCAHLYPSSVGMGIGPNERSHSHLVNFLLTGSAEI